MTPLLPLSGVRVLDFTRVLAGPFCTMLLADLDADVIKVESPAGDETRQWGPPYLGTPEHGLSAYYLSVNRGKRSIVLDLKSAHDADLARRLAAHSHIIVENLKPGGMAKFGLGYADLRAINPTLVYASITGFGQDGSYSARPGYDHTIQAMSGLMSITGEADGEPHKVGVAIVDVVTGLFAQSSILAALRHAERTGEGQHLDVSLLDSALAALVNVASSTLMTERVPLRYGNAHPNIVPYQVFRAADGDFVLAVGNDGQFAALCALIEQDEWALDARYATNPARLAHRDSLITALSDIFATRTTAEWVEAILAAGIPCAPINNLLQILNDPHIAARGLIQHLPISTGEQWRFVGNPVGFSATPPQVRRPPPLLGEHTAEVLREVLGEN